MPPSGNSISAGLPVVADIGPIPDHSPPVEPAKEIGGYSPSLDDCVPRGEALGIVEALASRKTLRRESTSQDTVLAENFIQPA